MIITRHNSDCLNTASLPHSPYLCICIVTVITVQFFHASQGLIHIQRTRRPSGRPAENSTVFPVPPPSPIWLCTIQTALIQPVVASIHLPFVSASLAPWFPLPSLFPSLSCSRLSLVCPVNPSIESSPFSYTAGSSPLPLTISSHFPCYFSLFLPLLYSCISSH